MALERRGNTFNFYYVSFETGELVLHESHVVPDMEDPVYVGMAVASHQDGELATAFWRNVGIEFRSFNIYETFSYPDEEAGTVGCAYCERWSGMGNRLGAFGANSPAHWFRFSKQVWWKISRLQSPQQVGIP